MIVSDDGVALGAAEEAGADGVIGGSVAAGFCVDSVVEAGGGVTAGFWGGSAVAARGGVAAGF